MKSVRLLPVVIMAIAALLVLKTMGLALTGSYVLGGVTTARAEEAAKPAEDGASPDGITIPSEPTLDDTSPTMADQAPTVGEAEGGHGAAAPETEPAKGVPAGAEGRPATESGDALVLPEGLELACAPTDATAVAHTAEPAPGEAAPADAHGEAAPADAHAEAAPADPAAHADPAADASADHGSDFAAGLTKPDCVPLVDGVPLQMDASGQPVPLTGEDGQSLSQTALLASLSQRRTELETYERELTLRASLVDAAEKKVQERQTTLKALEDQISSLVDQRTAMESGQFAGIVTLYENMKPKDAANIFNSLDMEVLLRVAKAMNPRKMSPILAAMDATRAQELTVRMAGLADQPVDQMTPADLAALPQIVGQ